MELIDYCFDCDFVLANIGVDGDVRKDQHITKELILKNYEIVDNNYKNYKKLLLEVDKNIIEKFEIKHKYGNKYFATDMEGVEIKYSHSWLSFKYKFITFYIFHRNERKNIVDEFLSEKIEELDNIVICGDGNITRPGYKEFNKYMENCGMKKMNIDYLYNSSEIDQNHKRNHNIEIYHKSPVFTLQCIMDKPMILNESSHIIVPFKIVDVVKILDTPETGKQFLEIRDKILTKYYEKIKDTINLEKHKTDCHIKCMYGKVNDPVFDQIVVQMYMSCIVAFFKLTDKIKKILDDNIFTRYFYEQIFKMVNSINIFSISCYKCLKYYKAQALIINSAQFYDSIVECLESVSLLTDETNYLMTNFKNLFKRARNKYNVDIINCAQVYIEIDSEMQEISDKYIKIEKFIKQKCISSTKTPDEHIEGFALDNSCDEIIKTLSNLATIKRNAACAKANVEHIETKSKDNDRSNKNVKKALINKGTRAFLDDKKLIHDSENKIKEIMNSI